MNTSLFDFGPLAWLLLIAAALAGVALLWLLRAYRHGSTRERLAALSVLLLVLTFDLTVFGAFTRLTDSGLGCPDWPGCYGTSSPLHASAHIEAAQGAAPTGPVTHKKAWIEMVHRYLASAVGALIVVQTVWVFLLWRKSRGNGRTNLHKGLPYSPWWALTTLVWVIAQGLFGALTVTMKLFPLIVSMHLLGAMGLLLLLQAQSTWWRLALNRVSALTLPRITSSLLYLALLALVIQIALGAWVSTNYAVLACTTWPLCNGQLLPPAHYSEGFALWRELGMGADGGYLSAPAVLAIHLVHRWVAVPVIGILLLLAWQLRQYSRTDARWLAALVVAQFATGLSNIVLGWPLVAALAHTAGAAAMVIVLGGLLLRARHSSAFL